MQWKAVRLVNPHRESRSHAPVRTCVGCRDQADKSTLLRVVAQGTGSLVELVPDVDGRLPGRGAYLHPRPGCLDLAERRRAFLRALRRAGTPDTRKVRQWIEEHTAASADRGSRTGQEEGDTT